MPFVLAPLGVILASALACSTGEVAAPASNALPVSAPTYHRDVAPILARSCLKCHHEGGIGPFSLTSYDEARAMAAAITTEVGARRMPPWGAHDTDECRPRLPWRDDERLSEHEIATLEQWEAAGAPEGDPADAPVEAAPLQSLNLVTPTLELAAKTAFQPQVTSGDLFRCFVLEAPEIEAGGFVSAVHVIPGNRAINHHVSVYADVGGIAAKRAGPDGSFDCSREAGDLGAKVDGEKPILTWLLAWAPGMRPLELPGNLGIKVHPTSKIVMEVHYAMSGTIPEPDRTRLQIRMAPAKPEYRLSQWGTGNFTAPLENGDGLLPAPDDPDGKPEFRIPAGARDHVEEMQQTCGVTGPLRIFGLRAHAHLAAVDVKIDVLRDGGSECLLQDRWDFHWQRAYTYDAPFDLLPTVSLGEKVRIRCTYDNSMMNRRLATELWARGLQPMDTYLGDGTMNEMCLADLMYVEKNP